MGSTEHLINRNAAWPYIRRSTARGASLLAALPFKIDDASVLFGAELALARKHNLTAYDAAYLELALRADCKLATLDTALARAAEEYGLRFQ
jgi:predicted nucleic acid-binding protein